MRSRNLLGCHTTPSVEVRPSDSPHALHLAQNVHRLPEITLEPWTRALEAGYHVQGQNDKAPSHSGLKHRRRQSADLTLNMRFKFS